MPSLESNPGEVREPARIEGEGAVLNPDSSHSENVMVNGERRATVKLKSAHQRRFEDNAFKPRLRSPDNERAGRRILTTVKI